MRREWISEQGRRYHVQLRGIPGRDRLLAFTEPPHGRRWFVPVGPGFEVAWLEDGQLEALLRVAKGRELLLPDAAPPP